uniref:ZAD domain-containing protein n=1 Tax=Glossina austeni TaxID=7395 RepID=A0A1A9UHV2_GLOAU
MSDIFNNLCRACNTQQNDLLSICNTQLTGASTTILEMLEYCTPSSVENSKMCPEYICYNCAKRLEISYHFLKRYKLAQQEFEVSHKLLHQKENIDNVQQTMLPHKDEMYEEFFGKASLVQYTVALKNNLVAKNTRSTTNLSPAADNVIDAATVKSFK